MAYNDLREWITALDKAGELIRIKAEADPILEIAEITDRVSKWGPRGSHGAGGPALLFENVKGHPGSRLLINQFGSARRMAMALDVDSLDEISERIKMFMDVKSPQGLLDKIKMLPMLAEMGKFFPKTVATGACKEVIQRDNFSLLDFPILQCWPHDGGRFITLPSVITRDPKTGKRNAGTYRMQIYDERTAGMHWQRQKIGAEHYREQMRRAAAAGEAHPTSAALDIMARSGGGSRVAEWKQVAGRMDVAVAIGTEPAVMFSSIVPAPPDVEEYLIAGFLRQKPLELVKCETVDLEVPASSEIVLEGYVELDELRMEGPFGDHTGFYTPEDLYPVFHVTCITQRKHPTYLTTVVGPPPQEDFWIGHAIERIFLPVMKMQYPEITDVSMPAEGIFQNLMIVAIRKSYPGHARKIMNAIWSLGQAMFTKVILVVDHDVDVHNPSEVVWKALCAIDPERDTQFTFGPVDTLDHAARMQDYGSKMGIDATRKWKTEGYAGRWPDEIRMDSSTRERVDKLWKDLNLKLRERRD